MRSIWNIKSFNVKFILPLIIITVVSAVVYLNSLNNEFQYDDEPDIVRNTYLEKPENIPRFFIGVQFYRDEIQRTDHYRPLLYLTYSLNKIAGGNNPFGYHLVNLAFHVGSAILLFMIIRAMLYNGTSDIYIALASALIFAVHPFNAEAVNYITARSSLMSGFFYLLALYCWVKFRGSGRTAYFYPGALLAFLLGMLSKEVVITLPIALWLYDLYFVHSPRTLHAAFRTFINWRTYLSYLPFVLAVAIPALVVRVIYWGSVVPSFKRSLPVQLYTELPALAKYLKLFVFPVGLSIEHQQEVYRGFFEWPVILSALILLLYLLLAVVASRSMSMAWKVLSFFMIWFFIVLLPTIIIPLNAIFQENRGYLAVIVFTVFAGVVLGKILELSGTVKRYASVMILMILVLCYSAGTIYRNSVWRNGISLWSDAVAKAPESSRAHTNLGTEYSRIGRNDRAIEHYMMALKFPVIDDKVLLTDIHYNLGTVYQQMGKDDMAISEYKISSVITPSDFRPYYNMGVIYQQKGELETASEAYKKVIERNISHFKSYHNLGILHYNRGDIAIAEEFYRKALYFNPDYIRSLTNLASLYEENGDLIKARELYIETLRRNPGDIRIQAHIRNLEDRLISSPLP